MSDLRLYCPGLRDRRVEVSPEEARHALAARRLRSGDRLTLFDGIGTEADAVITSARKNDLALSAGPIREVPFELDHRLTIAVAMPKSPRQGHLIEKCTELGVAAIRPILAEHGVVRFKGDPSNKWRRRAIEAAKQSRRAWIPEFDPPCSLADDLRRITEFDLAVIAQIGADESLADRLRELPERSRIIAYVGPEGGWSDAEVARARAHGVIAVRLSPTVLRTETAAIAVCALVAAMK